MRVYKEKQFLIFELDDGKTVKYDFATKTAIGKKGKPVKNLCKQLSEYTLQEIIDSCTNEQYGKFLKYVQKNSMYSIHNIGTILNHVPLFSKYEQLFSAGYDDIIDMYNFRYNINDIPKCLVKICRENNFKITNQVMEIYKSDPNAFCYPFKMEFISLTPKDILTILQSTVGVKYFYGENQWQYRYNYLPGHRVLIEDYGYTVKALFNFCDYCKTFEAIEDMGYLIREIFDYAKMMKEISNKFDKYPRHFLTTHKIACRNYNRMQQVFSEEKFKKRINKDYEYSYKDYKFIYPKNTQDIKDEAASQNNCVASYIDRVINGGCHILFLRKKDTLDKSLVTIEIRENKIVQARRKFNDPVTSDDQEAIDAWNKKFQNYKEAA